MVNKEYARLSFLREILNDTAMNRITMLSHKIMSVIISKI